VTVATLVARNANEVAVVCMVAPGGFWIWREFGVRWSVLCWRELGFDRRQDVCTFNLMRKDTLKVLHSQCFCEVGIAINFITFRHKKFHFRQI
jgi:hypothetical protein